MRHLRSSLALLACGSAVALFVLPSSLASAGGKPTRAPIPDAAVTFDFPAGLACGFEVAGQPVVNHEYTTTFPAEANGDVTVSTNGRLVEKISNVATGSSITVNISGPGTLIFHADGSISGTVYGPSLMHLFPTDIPAGPRFIVNHGRIDATITASGQFILKSITGTQFDICAALS